jgi:hypothetical protein
MAVAEGRKVIVPRPIVITAIPYIKVCDGSFMW